MPVAIGGAGITAVDSIVRGFATNNLGSTDGRWMSIRVVRCGMKIFS